MKKISRILVLLFFLITLDSISQSDTLTKTDSLVWYTDLVQASEISKSSNKPIFALFTGSDWCYWCKKLQNDVLSKPDFIEWANDNVVLLEVDFPRKKSISPELSQQNINLQQAFQVQGYPTIWIFFLTINDMKYEIESLGSVGYPQEPEAGKEEVKFLMDANLILSNRKKGK